MIIYFFLKDDEVTENPFFIINLDDIYNKHINWITRMPRVEPFYAVKVNTDKLILKLLSFLGTGFDCASKDEIEKILEMNVKPNRIIYANPCKQISYLKYACKMGVSLMTFDNELELYKIKEHYPDAKCVLRIKTNDSNAKWKLSNKFGADMEISKYLIEKAISLNLDLVGVCFHVGSGQMFSTAFIEPIQNARVLFDFAREKFEVKMHLLDIGGGYPGSNNNLFNEISEEINHALERYFPIDFFAHINGIDEKKLRIIAEPGTYYVCSAFTLFTKIFAKRVMIHTKKQEDIDKLNICNESSSSILIKENLFNAYHPIMINPEKSFLYYINEGFYGSFHYKRIENGNKPYFIKEFDESCCYFKSSIRGPSTDKIDFIVENYYLPELEIGDIIGFKNMGDYTTACAMSYNDYPSPINFYVAAISAKLIDYDFPEQSLIVHEKLNLDVRQNEKSNIKILFFKDKNGHILFFQQNEFNLN